MLDIMYFLGLLVPACVVYGTVEMNRPILNEDGSPSGTFENLTLTQQQEQYDLLRWEDERTKPTWDELLAFIEANPIKPPLIDRLSAIVDTLSDEDQAKFSYVIAPAFVALTNDKPNVARLIISGAEVPVDLQELKDRILSEFYL